MGVPSSGPPETRDELEEMAGKVRGDSGTKHDYVFRGADYESGVFNTLEYAWTSGGGVLDAEKGVLQRFSERSGL